MKTTILSIATLLLLGSCKTALKLSVPQVFKEQATMVHVEGARKRVMTFENFATTKIKRGVHVSYPGWNRGFFLENILLNSIGLQKNEHVIKEKDKFRYTIADGKNKMEVLGKERKLTKSIEYKLLEGAGIFNSFTQLQESRYIFSAMIIPDPAKDTKSWELLMSNIYERKNDPKKRLFPIIRPDDDGLATNGTDTIYIRSIAVNETEGPSEKKGRFPIKMLSGYELSTQDGVVAIIDLIARDLWFYNELGPADKLIIAAITTAIFARRVNDNKW
jgi:hypothetical protein